MAPRRVVCVVLPYFRVAIVRARSFDLLPSEPLGLVIHETHDERDLSGGVRLDEVSREAEGVRPGDTIAHAKSKMADLRVRVVRPAETSRALQGLAEMLLAFGAITSPLASRDCVLVDVTGCAHLHGGEEALLVAITSAVKRAGFSCRAALASGPEMAWAFAHAGRAGVVRPDEMMDALGALPIDVLRLAPETTSYFHKLGVSTLAELRSLPRRTLASRTDSANLAARVRALLDGHDDTPIVRYVPERLLEERADLEWSLSHHEALVFVLKSLCDRLCVRLQARCMLASRLEVLLELDRGMCPEAEPTESLSLSLASPVGRSDDILTTLRARLEHEPPLRAPIRAVSLRAPELVPAQARTRHLFEPESRAELALPTLVAELAALLGPSASGRSLLYPTGASIIAPSSWGSASLARRASKSPHSSPFASCSPKQPPRRSRF